MFLFLLPGVEFRLYVAYSVQTQCTAGMERKLVFLENVFRLFRFSKVFKKVILGLIDFLGVQRRRDTQNFRLKKNILCTILHVTSLSFSVE